jgi:hypothetical protein
MILPWTNPTQLNSTQLNPTQPNPTQPNATQLNSTQPNPTQSNPTQPNPTKPNPTQPNPTQLNSTRPNPTQTLGSGILYTRVVGHVLPQKCPGSSDKMCSQTIISTSNTNKKPKQNKKEKKHSIKVLYLLNKSSYSLQVVRPKPYFMNQHIRFWVWNKAPRVKAFPK